MRWRRVRLWMRPAKFFKKLFLLYLFLPVLVNIKCSFNDFLLNQTASMMEAGQAAFETETDLEIAEISLAANLKLIESLLQQNPENIRLRIFLAQGYSLYSLAFVEDKYEEYQYSDPEKSEYHRKRAVNFYIRARDLAGIKIFKKLGISSVENITKENLEKYLQSVKIEDINHLFWFAFSWGSSINLQRDNIFQLASLPFIEMIMEKVKHLDERYYYGGVFLFEGMYFGGRPPMLGGNLDKSNQSFQKAMEISDKKLMLIPFFKAKTYCIQIQDSTCFKENIDLVLNTPENAFPRHNLANAIARKKALRLKEHFNDYFLEED